MSVHPRQQSHPIPPGEKLTKEWWGACAWDFLQAMAFSYPRANQEPDSKQRLAFSQILHGLVQTLPCIACRTHWSQLLRENPPQLENRQTAVRWVFDAHNEVNARLGKPQYPWVQLIVDFVEPRALSNWLQGEELEEAEDLVAASSASASLASSTSTNGKSCDEQLRNYKIATYSLGLGLLIFIVFGSWARHKCKKNKKSSKKKEK